MHYGKKMNIMQANPKIGSMDAVLDKLYGKVGKLLVTHGSKRK